MDYLILDINLLSSDQFSNLSGPVATNSDLDADRIFPAIQQSSFFLTDVRFYALQLTSARNWLHRILYSLKVKRLRHRNPMLRECLTRAFF